PNLTSAICIPAALDLALALALALACAPADGAAIPILLASARQRIQFVFQTRFLAISALCRVFLVSKDSVRTIHMDIAGPRWKGKDSALFAKENPMSKLVEQLQASLAELGANAQLSGCSALLHAGPELADLLDRACFGRRIATSEQDAHWFELGLEEAFYMAHDLECLAISAEDGKPMNGAVLWAHMRSKQETFPDLYRAYSHLRSKNWVVRSGTQYGVDFVAYRHHPALVHSDYAVLVLPEGDEDKSSPRLRVWSDLQCTLRVAGSVAKTLLVLSIKGSCRNLDFPLCLEQSIVEERVIRRWVPEQCRENH
ncbi:hypothetical protein Taro_052943, partial [Colocasia esculenta]|nr:hypothetical protein [Colocasia esculenta]